MADDAPLFSPEWTIELVDRPEHSMAVEALLCTSGGDLATRAVSEVDRDRPPTGLDGGTRVAGVYGPEPPGELLTGPHWIPRFPSGRGRSWRLDLRHGVVEHTIELEDGQEVRTLRFSPPGRPGTSVHWVQSGPDQSNGLPEPGPLVLAGTDRRVVIASSRRTDGPAVVQVAAIGDDRLDACRTASETAARGGPALLAGQVEVWERRWDRADVEIDGPAADTLAARFALFHLLSLDPGQTVRELAVGARGLTGPAYAGHVFWDADVFVLPALAAIAPDAAAAMLRYRANRLRAARLRAAGEGRPGARYPWESAGSGCEVTPTTATLLDGTRIPILTGEQEIHINSDIAWAILHHARWTGDHGFLSGTGATIITETARYLASRIELDDAGSGHLREVIGPDEYHEAVDDNAYTNILTRWHLQEAAALTDDAGEAARWLSLAASLVDGYRRDEGRHEQFAGYDALDPVVVAAVADPPVAADLLLGREIVSRSQIVKQADVIMAHHLLPGAMPAGSRDRDLAHYLPRTAHGSSLSPAIHASVLARAHRPDEALHWLRLALRLDLDDLTGTTAGGLHTATMGGVWQALAFGFLGLSVVEGVVGVDPVLPREWRGLRLRCRVRGRVLDVRASRDEIELEADGPLTFGWPGAPAPRTIDRLHLLGGPGEWRLAT